MSEPYSDLDFKSPVDFAPINPNNGNSEAGTSTQSPTVNDRPNPTSSMAPDGPNVPPKTAATKTNPTNGEIMDFFINAFEAAGFTNPSQYPSWFFASPIGGPEPIMWMIQGGLGGPIPAYLMSKHTLVLASGSVQIPTAQARATVHEQSKAEKGKGTASKNRGVKESRQRSPIIHDSPMDQDDDVQEIVKPDKAKEQARTPVKARGRRDDKESNDDFDVNDGLKPAEAYIDGDQSDEDYTPEANKSTIRRRKVPYVSHAGDTVKSSIKNNQTERVSRRKVCRFMIVLVYFCCYNIPQGLRCERCIKLDNPFCEGILGMYCLQCKPGRQLCSLAGGESS